MKHIEEEHLAVIVAAIYKYLETERAEIALNQSTPSGWLQMGRSQSLYSRNTVNIRFGTWRRPLVTLSR